MWERKQFGKTVTCEQKQNTGGGGGSYRKNTSSEPRTWKQDQRRVQTKMNKSLAGDDSSRLFSRCESHGYLLNPSSWRGEEQLTLKSNSFITQLPIQKIMSQLKNAIRERTQIIQIRSKTGSGKSMGVPFEVSKAMDNDITTSRHLLYYQQ